MQRYRISSAAWKFSNTLRSLYLDKNITRDVWSRWPAESWKLSAIFFSVILYRWYDNLSISYLNNTYNKDLHTVFQYQYLGSGPKWWWQPMAIYPPTVDDAWFHFEPWHGIPRHVQCVVFFFPAQNSTYMYIFVLSEFTNTKHDKHGSTIVCLNMLLVSLGDKSHTFKNKSKKTWYCTCSTCMLGLFGSHS